MFLDDPIDDLGVFLDGLRRTLEFEEEAVLFEVFPLGLTEEVCCYHEIVVDQFNAFFGGVSLNVSYIPRTR